VLRLFLVASKALGEFSSGNGSHSGTRKLRMMSNLRKNDPLVNGDRFKQEGELRRESLISGK
jgi:hypothetical protein